MGVSSPSIRVYPIMLHHSKWFPNHKDSEFFFNQGSFIWIFLHHFPSLGIRCFMWYAYIGHRKVYHLLTKWVNSLQQGVFWQQRRIGTSGGQNYLGPQEYHSALINALPIICSRIIKRSEDFWITIIIIMKNPNHHQSYW